ncbi:uncharacterized protein LOC143917238 [Arctopsyche grandis]|uniref:uncharacterized protein LOC143917238 n=1 Tax=Arctopsyche grandis TaxID=121162 RepID=UPI00406D826C
MTLKRLPGRILPFVGLPRTEAPQSRVLVKMANCLLYCDKLWVSQKIKTLLKSAQQITCIYSNISRYIQDTYASPDKRLASRAVVVLCCVHNIRIRRSTFVVKLRDSSRTTTDSSRPLSTISFRQWYCGTKLSNNPLLSSHIVQKDQMDFDKLSLIVFAFLVVKSAFGLHVEDYCSTNTWQFTKEVNSTEYAVVNRAKRLNCCAKAYRLIEWYKDSRVYPWNGDVSSFILYPEAANQTINTQRAVATDSGNYICIVKNATHMNSHIIRVIIIEPPPAPRVTIKPKDQQVMLGQSVTLYCEADIGPKTYQHGVSWKKVYPEGTNLRNQQKTKISGEDDKIIGSYLEIRHMKSQDFGQYICSVFNMDSTINMPMWLNPPDNAGGRSFCRFFNLFCNFFTIILFYRFYI